MSTLQLMQALAMCAGIQIAIIVVTLAGLFGLG